jgi:hypothetical protein
MHDLAPHLVAPDHHVMKMLSFFVVRSQEESDASRQGARELVSDGISTKERFNA